MDDHIERLIEAVLRLTTSAQLNDMNAHISAMYGRDQLSDFEAEKLYLAIDTRRKELFAAREEQRPPSGTYFPMRPKTERSRDQAASGKRCPIRWSRKRRLGSREALEPAMHDHFTEGERAVLFVIAADHKNHGRCDCSMQEISDRAGVGITTVRYALRKARKLGLIAVTERRQWRAKNLPNIVHIICEGWKRWLARFKPKLGFNYQNIALRKATSSETYGKNKTDKKNGQPSYRAKDSPTGRIKRFAYRQTVLP